MRILFISHGDPREKRTWSGTARQQYRALLELGHQVEVALVPDPSPPMLLEKIKWHINWRFRKQIYLIEVAPRYLSRMQSVMAAKYSDDQFDLLFAWHPFHALLLPTKKPMVFWYDATFQRSIPGYFQSAMALSKRQGIAAEGEAIRRSSAAIFSSEWAAAAAVADYGCPANKVFTVPFGANLDSVPDPATVMAHIQRRVLRWPGEVRLLFVGLAWERKDGATALGVVNELRRRGVAATLTFVGVTPDLTNAEKAYVRVVPRLNKNNPDELRTLYDLYLEHDLFIMTSRFESYGIVYCEAMAMGLPSIATNTGGVGTIVQNGKTGFLFERTPDLVQHIAARVQALVASPEQYVALATSSRENYDSTFNWSAAGTSIGSILDRVMAKHRGGV